MTTQKIITLVVYTILAFAWWRHPKSKAGLFGKWFFVALPIVHLLELVFVWQWLEQASGSFLGHVGQTLIFGFVHWLPIYQGLN